MSKRLETAFDQANHVVIVTVARVGMLHVKSLQKLHVKLGMMPDVRPFLYWHDRSKNPIPGKSSYR